MATKKFDPATYQVEQEIQYTTENGHQTTNFCPVDNIVRWRQAEGEKVPEKTSKELREVNDVTKESVDKFGVESNARLVEWSDGTFSIAIGDELFEIRQEDLHNSSVFLKYDSEIAVMKSALTEKMYVKPSHKSTRHVQMHWQQLKEHREAMEKRGH